ncbi:ubiquinone biosynthesis O-methyltransferase [Wolfiporia cocos MD-104 SS10]|uniref:Ubiquinone biosynthesis O-methyltransferase n=1 Tax=Wolfiporia cocos (strain MD-104) TaxID=742152 RepID=A0A2H3JS81_WOLCO|nr:ubiquinone biosynthesis O-methyltransferase [Wolfiporia cocos MD-104 SS10]
MLHAMNPARVQFMTQKLMEMRREEDSTADVDETTVLRGLDVLDVGCGGGLLCETLTRLGALTLGIDASAENIGIASMHASADPALNFTHSSPDGSVPSRAYSSRGGLTYMHTAVENLLSGQHVKQFDVVCSMEVLEHVDNPGTFLRNCAALVKPGGHLFLSTIARTPLAYALTILAAEDVLRLVTPGTHTYSKFVNPSELLDFFASASSLESDRPWISRLFDGVPARTEAETRGIVFVPWRGEWALVPRSAPGAKLWSEGCNYLFWVRRPLLS